ncbi:MAG TPA: hypothetical protein VJT73_06580 [Polyangiaceae bacterium]|nr:hypothetical protein [Polyangiaceae bacterium]
MLARSSKSAWIAFAGFAFALTLLTSSRARAEESIIKRPGDHPAYSVEAEPHLLAAFFLPRAGSNGVGIGGRFTFPIVKNGFVSSINNSVGIGVGLDWVHYNGCYGYFYDYRYSYCSNLDSFIVPVVMQWNFFLSTHWSVFAEPGLSFAYHSWGNGNCPTVVRNGVIVQECGNGPSHFDINPVTLFVGGRYHFSETVSLTMRIGWPYASIGVSFMP